VKVKVESLVKSYQRGAEVISVLKNIAFEIPSGERVAILGPSGSGKSTLLSLLAGLDRYDSGTIQMGDTAFESLDDSGLTDFRAKNVGIVFQQFHLISTLNALENVALPLELMGARDATAKALNLLEAVGLSHRLKHFPSELSGGECQRVAMARALVTDAKLILADEPSGNLDSKTGAQVMDLLFDLVKKSGATLILVTHNEELALRCDKVVRLLDGRFQ
jgi:putative ABC transport system ATP-binding protein